MYFQNTEVHLKKILYILVGSIAVVLGAVGAVVPMLPTVPFLMLAAFCFARSSDRLDRWLKGTKLYRENLKDLAERRGMTKKAKIRVMATVTILMSIGFALMGMKGIVSGCIVLSAIWLIHLLYFLFGVKTLRAEGE